MSEALRCALIQAMHAHLHLHTRAHTHTGNACTLTLTHTCTHTHTTDILERESYLGFALSIENGLLIRKWFFGTPWTKPLDDSTP